MACDFKVLSGMLRAMFLYSFYKVEFVKSFALETKKFNLNC